MKRKDLKEVIKGILDDRKQILLEEALYYEGQARANASYWGYGGPVPRQEKAAEKRRREIEEVEQLESQLRRSVTLRAVPVHAWHCRDCGALTITTKYPSGEWHECGSCRKMLHESTLQHFEIETPDDRYFGVLIRRLKESREETEHEKDTNAI